MKFTSIFTVLFAMVMAPLCVNADITIDTYTAGTTLTQFGAGTASQTTFDASILGGQRDETIVVTPQGTNDEFFGTLGFSGEMDVAQGSQDQIFGSVVYDNFAPTDMTEGGLNDSFELGFLSSDINAELSNVVSLTVGSGANFATQFVTVPSNDVLPQNVLVDFSSFAGVDMTAIDSVALNFNFAGNPGRDFELGLFSATKAIPEPASGIIVAVGLLAMARRRRS